jgi:hypothetical protein
MEKKTTKKVVKKSATKKVAEKSAPKKVIRKKVEVSVEEDEFDFFNFDIPRSVYARLFWTYFKMYIKSFFRK